MGIVEARFKGAADAETAVRATLKDDDTVSKIKEFLDNNSEKKEAAQKVLGEIDIDAALDAADCFEYLNDNGADAEMIEAIRKLINGEI